MTIDAFQRYYAMPKPCANCPFLKSGAIELRPGRLKGIVESLLANDHETFVCHKTVHCSKGGDWDEEAGEYRDSGNEMACAVATLYLLNQGRPSVGMRLAMAFGVLQYKEMIVNHGKLVVDQVN